jgi:hypothetical protein
LVRWFIVDIVRLDWAARLRGRRFGGVEVLRGEIGFWRQEPALSGAEDPRVLGKKGVRGESKP